MVKIKRVLNIIIVCSLMAGLLVGCANDTSKSVENEVSFAEEETEWKNTYEQYQDLCKEAEKIDGLSIGITSDTAKELAEEKILGAYAENTVLTAEIKQLMINSFSEKDAVHMETGGDKAGEKIDAFLDDVVVKVAFSNFEGGAVTDILSDGVKSYISTARSGSSEEALEAAKESVKEGVTCKVKSAVLGNVGDILDETSKGLGDLVKSFDGASSIGEYLENVADAKSDGAVGKAKGLIESAKDVADTLNDSGYEGEPGALINGYYKTAKKASEEVNEILSNKKTTGNDLARLLYKYYQFGSVLNGLKDMGVESGYEWEENYETANELYKRYLYNEKLISLLEVDGDFSTSGNVKTISVDKGYLDSAKLVPLEQKNNGEKEAYQKELESDIGWMKEAIGALSSDIEEVKSELAPMQEYRNQVDEIKNKSQGILDYEAKEFEATLNEDGIEGQKEINSFNSKVASVTEIVPVFGSGLSAFFENVAASSDRYYEHVVKTAELIGNSFEPISLNVKEKVEDYHDEIRFYEDLTEEKDNLQDEINNLYLLRDVLRIKDIDVSESKEAAYKSLLILGYAYDVTESFYESINPDSSGDMEELADEIDEIMVKDDMGQLDGQVKTEEAAKYLIPIYDAGLEGMRLMDDISVDSDDIKFPFMMASTGSGLFDNTRVHYTLFCGEPIHIHDDKGIINIFISGEKVLSVNGNYIYRNAILNNSGSGRDLAEFGQWTRRMCLEEEDSREFALKQDILQDLASFQTENEGKLTEECIGKDETEYDEEDE